MCDQPLPLGSFYTSPVQQDLVSIESSIKCGTDDTVYTGGLIGNVARELVYGLRGEDHVFDQIEKWSKESRRIEELKDKAKTSSEKNKYSKKEEALNQSITWAWEYIDKCRVERCKKRNEKRRKKREERENA